MRTLFAYLNDRRVGTLSEGNDLWQFEYDPLWTADPASFDLSPALPRSTTKHEDQGTHRPVQWYFDNLLPEEGMRDIVSREAEIRGDDAFGLLEWLGAESAGSLALLPPGKDPGEPGGLKPLPDEELSERIRNLRRASLGSTAPKRMSAAGAQHKLLVVYRDGVLYEPMGSEPSTHILKPNHMLEDYPASVINEYVTMRLASDLGLRAPAVMRRYTPEPVYIVERFDRYQEPTGRTQRRHIIDACQLLNKARGFKYRAATLQTLADIVPLSRIRASTRMRLFSWMVFNLLVANNDNHLKNLSFTVSADGIELAPAYDLLSTGTYHTRAFAHGRADWPGVDMAIALPGATTYDQVTRESVLRAGDALGLAQRTSERELDRMVSALPGTLAALVRSIEADNGQYPEPVRRFLAGETRLMRALESLVVPEMIAKVGPAKAGRIA